MTWPTESAGRWLEPRGNARPRGMTVTPGESRATESRLPACFTTPSHFVTPFARFVAKPSRLPRAPDNFVPTAGHFQRCVAVRPRRDVLLPWRPSVFFFG